MGYLIPAFIGMYYFVFQFYHRKDTIGKYGTNSYLTSESGNVYPLFNICYIGGDTTQINVNDGFLGRSKNIPPLAEIRYGRESYIVKNIDEKCYIRLKREDKTWDIPMEQELSLVADDVLQVFFQNELVHSYTFRWGEVEKNEVV